jgi:hypothetical protein
MDPMAVFCISDTETSGASRFIYAPKIRQGITYGMVLVTQFAPV